MFKPLKWLALVGVMSAQLSFSAVHERHRLFEYSPAPVPSVDWLRLASMGEDRLVATALSLYVQGFDSQGGAVVPLRKLNFDRVQAYLRRSGEMAPQATYPLFLASRVYANTAPREQARQLLDWVEERYRESPETHWPWLAYAVHLAKHRLADPRLAQQYANTLRVNGDHADIPQWARDLEIFLLADLDEFEAARVLVGGLIAEGKATDERALKVMLGDLERLQRRRSVERGKTADRRPRVRANPSEIDTN